ncbi:hypothetical protein EX30DRAFT_341947 [Ascodesmis nigricans]|uniref:Uncharacterized protein n=1 Tax=Ascodesmis nigricans TaxID=341454 RepID=A0A4S2MTP1_9PEZI|nr:hypothetical protein EX30DRAFT_341947 [Ascodesmis nigricans]
MAPSTVPTPTPSPPYEPRHSTAKESGITFGFIVACLFISTILLLLLAWGLIVCYNRRHAHIPQGNENRDVERQRRRESEEGIRMADFPEHRRRTFEPADPGRLMEAMGRRR